ncbi:hypothetical protein TNCV_3123841 [Trichonephila clavipes]|nr:hypothetical protein TNCV_3123841 [Trichonephila clavipes]
MKTSGVAQALSMEIIIIFSLDSTASILDETLVCPTRKLKFDAEVANAIFSDFFRCCVHHHDGRICIWRYRRDCMLHSVSSNGCFTWWDDMRGHWVHDRDTCLRHR